MKNLRFKISYIFLIAIAALVWVTACKKDDEDPAPVKKSVGDDGLTDDITNLVPAVVLDSIRALDMTINGGNNPPDITNNYQADPFILKNSNIPTDFIGVRESDYLVEFSNLDLINLTVDIKYLNGAERGTGVGGFIVGDGTKFSVFTEVVSAIGNDSADFVHVISGELNNDGIKDFYFANFMIDDRGDPNEVFIEIGQGRVLWDRDSLAEERGPFSIGN